MPLFCIYSPVYCKVITGNMRKDKVFEDVEVHDMGDMERDSARKGADREQSDTKAVQSGAPAIWKAISVLIAMAALAYDISPIDVMPDSVPVLGWIDDFGVSLVAALNVYQQFAKDQGALSVRMAKYIKWIMIALLVIAGVAVCGLLALLVAFIMSLVN